MLTSFQLHLVVFSDQISITFMTSFLISVIWDALPKDLWEKPEFGAFKSALHKVFPSKEMNSTSVKCLKVYTPHMRYRLQAYH